MDEKGSAIEWAGRNTPALFAIAVFAFLIGSLINWAPLISVSGASLSVTQINGLCSSNPFAAAYFSGGCGWTGFAGFITVVLMTVGILSALVGALALHTKGLASPQRHEIR